MAVHEYASALFPSVVGLICLVFYLKTCFLIHNCSFVCPNAGCRALREGRTPRAAWRHCGQPHQLRLQWYSLSQPHSRYRYPPLTCCSSNDRKYGEMCETT